MKWDESNICIIEGDMKGGYSNVELNYALNPCVHINIWVKDGERGTELLKIIHNRLKDIDMSKDVEYLKKYEQEAGL